MQFRLSKHRFTEVTPTVDDYVDRIAPILIDRLRRDLPVNKTKSLVVVAPCPESLQEGLLDPVGCEDWRMALWNKISSYNLEQFSPVRVFVSTNPGGDLVLALTAVRWF